MADNDLEVMYPEAVVTVAGREVTVHEYTFREGLHVDAIAAPLKTALADLFLGDEDGGETAGEASMSELSAAFSADPDVMVSLLALATGEPEDWIDALGDADGQTLLMAWWTVNRDFFLRRLLGEMALQQARKTTAAASPGDASTPH